MMRRFLFKATRKAHQFSGRLHAWAAERYPNAEQYAAEGSIPWSGAYGAARATFVERQLVSREMMAHFASESRFVLPEGYGWSLDERCVEWPWAIANIGDALHVLDAGSALNHRHLLSLSLWKGRALDIFTLAPEDVCEWRRGISYLFGDLRRMPYRDQEFDLIVSISTLEHIGMDNSAFSGRERHKEHSAEDVFLVLSEWRRILKPGGRLLFSVPYGRYGDYGSFQQFDADLLESCAQCFAPVKRRDSFFLYSEKGWQAVEQTDCARAVYAVNAPKTPEPDRAAAARAVACCQWWV